MVFSWRFERYPFVGADVSSDVSSWRFERRFELTFRALALRRAVCSDEGLTLETSAKHHIPQATNIPYQPCWSNPYFIGSFKRAFACLTSVCLSPFLPLLCLWLSPSVCLSVCLSVWVSVCLSVSFFASSLSDSLRPSVCLSVYLSVRLSVSFFASSLSDLLHPSVCLSAYLCICLSVCLPVSARVCAFLCLSVWLS